MKKPLIILTGPTAVGKTETSIRLAQAVNGEIISADSIQVYRHMDIGSAKIRPEEMEGVPHYLVDCLDPDETFDITVFQRMTLEAMDKIYAKGKIPMIVGGTGFYIQAVLYGIEFEEEENDTDFRESLYAYAAEFGAHALHERLQAIDEASAEAIHENNIKRVARAIEYYEKTGQKMSEHNEEQHQKEAAYNFAYFVLNDNRDRLYERIEKRIDLMMEQGLLDEVKALKDMGYDRSLVSMQGLGYKELLAYLEGECTLEDAVRILKRDTRHFAKRQLTWFRREKDVIWVDKAELDYDNEKILSFLLEHLKEKGILS